LQTILFNRTSNFITGIDREKLPYEYSVLLPFDIQLSKTRQESTGQLIQKVNSENQTLYKDNIIIDPLTNVETFDEVTYSEKVISTQTQINTYRIATEEYTTEIITDEFGEEQVIQTPIYTEIQTTSEVPVSWENLDPIMIPEIINKTVTLENNMLAFNYEEVLEAKIQSINNNSLTSICYFDEDFLGNDLILSNCSIGDGILILHGQNAQVGSPLIELPTPKSIIELYIESQPEIEVQVSGDNINFIPFINNSAILPIPSTTLYFKITNTSTSNRELYAIGILA